MTSRGLSDVDTEWSKEGSLIQKQHCASMSFNMKVLKRKHSPAGGSVGGVGGAANIRRGEKKTRWFKWWERSSLGEFCLSGPTVVQQHVGHPASYSLTQAGPVSWLNSRLIRHDACLGDERALRASNSFDTNRSIIGPTCDPALPEHIGRGACGGNVWQMVTDPGVQRSQTRTLGNRGDCELLNGNMDHGACTTECRAQSVQSRPSVIDPKHPAHRNNNDQNLASIYKLGKN